MGLFVSADYYAFRDTSSTQPICRMQLEGERKTFEP